MYSVYSTLSGVCTVCTLMCATEVCLTRFNETIGLLKLSNATTDTGKITLFQ